MTDKEKRKNLLIEIIQEDEKNGMYEVDPLDKFMDEEIAYLKSCNPVNKWGRLENEFANGMIHAYERIKSEREWIARKSVNPSKP